MALSGGYPSSVDITYGLDIAYICQTNSPHFLKIGLVIGRFKMGKYKNDVELDAILEDEFHESFKPYFEWRWDLSGFSSKQAIAF